MKKATVAKNGGIKIFEMYDHVGLFSQTSYCILCPPCCVSPYIVLCTPYGLHPPAKVQTSFIKVFVTSHSGRGARNVNNHVELTEAEADGLGCTVFGLLEL